MTTPSASAVSVFISYSSKDRSFVLQLANDLKVQGFTIWLDVWNIKGRQPYWQEIEAGVESCTHCLFVISPDSIEPGCGARDELAHAKHKKKKLVVLMARAVDYNSLPIEITPGRYQIHDFTRLTYAEGLHRVTDALVDIPTPPVIHPTPAPVPKPQPKPIDWTKWGVIFAVIVGLLTVFATIAVPFIERILDNPSTFVAIVPTATAQVAAAVINTPETMKTPLPFDTPDPLAIALDRARNFTGTNDDWKALYPNGFVQTFNDVEMVLVPKGCFMMGGDSFADEQPVHEQCFDAPFWIDKYEVTNAQYGSIGCEEWSSEPNQPRNCVTWFEARDFCASRDARLPTEREWEYAARGVSNWEYPWGDEFVAENAVFGDNSGGKTANVGRGGASWAGALDMSGNVWEWVSSLYVDYEYNLDKSESDIDNTSARALRGGSFYYFTFYLRAADRSGSFPGYSFGFRGFRCSSSLK
jgi:formylglycine-generating enzyme required for sulfatase activity